MHLRRLMLLSLAGVLAVASPGYAAVFCVAGDGHAGVETVADPCCGDEWATFVPTKLLVAADADRPNTSCGPCVDLQLTSPSRLEAPTLGPALPVHGAPIQLDSTPTPALHVRAETQPAGRIAPPPTLDLLASVILLT